jgi:uncharacterized membrane protein
VTSASRLKDTIWTASSVFTATAIGGGNGETERLAKLAFEQIRQASGTTPAVLIRQLEAICRLATRLPNACRQALSDQADAILEIASKLVALDRRDLNAAWHRAHAVLEAPGAQPANRNTSA